MARGLRKVRPGQRLRGSMSASSYNQIVDAVHWIENFKHRQDVKPPEPRAGVVQVLNAETFAFNQFDIVGLDDILFSNSDNLTEFKNNAAFRGKSPTSSHLTKFAVLQEPITNGTNRIVGAVADGITIARLNIVDASHNYATVTAGEWTQFTTSTSGPVTILWKESGTGTSKWAVVCINNSSSASLPKGFFYDGGDCTLTVDNGTVDMIFIDAELPTGAPDGSVSYNVSTGEFTIEDDSQWMLHLTCSAEYQYALATGESVTFWAWVSYYYGAVWWTTGIPGQQAVVQVTSTISVPRNANTFHHFLIPHVRMEAGMKLKVICQADFYSPLGTPATMNTRFQGVLHWHQIK